MDVTAHRPLLLIEDLRVAYASRKFRRPPVEVIKGVTLDIRRGETVGLVGESGSGKSTIGRAVLGLAPVTGGRIMFEGRDIAHLPNKERRAVATDIQVVFQDPYSSLNPGMTIEEILVEPLVANGHPGGRERVRDLLDKVRLPADAGRRLAREFSGGQRQRIAIARALALNPKLVICDEPTSALDLTTQARILELLLEIQEQTGIAYLFITHDLDLVRAMSHRIAVMLDGHIVEAGTSKQISTAPTQAYTQRLQLAAPIANPSAQRERRARWEQLRTEAPGYTTAVETAVARSRSARAR